MKRYRFCQVWFGLPRDTGLQSSTFRPFRAQIAGSYLVFRNEIRVHLGVYGHEESESEVGFHVRVRVRAVVRVRVIPKIRPQNIPHSKELGGKPIVSKGCVIWSKTECFRPVQISTFFAFFKFFSTLISIISRTRPSRAKGHGSSFLPAG